jgi:hypothetical protein
MNSIVLRALSVAVAALCCATVHGQAPTPRRASPPRPAAPAPAAPAASGAERKVPFRPGETLTYDVSWSSYLTAGTATLTVKDVRPSGGVTAYYILAEAKPTGLLASLYTLYYKADTLLDSRTLLPQRASIYSQEGDRRRTRVTQFDHAALRADYEVKTGSTARNSVTLPKYTQDILSAIYALRAVPLKSNAGFTMPVCDGGKIYRVRFNVGPVETVRAGNVPVQAFRVTPSITDAAGRTTGRPVTLWIASDARQVPVKVQANLTVGSITLTLR